MYTEERIIHSYLAYVPHHYLFITPPPPPSISWGLRKRQTAHTPATFKTAWNSRPSDIVYYYCRPCIICFKNCSTNRQLAVFVQPVKNALFFVFFCFVCLGLWRRSSAVGQEVSWGSPGGGPLPSLLGADSSITRSIPSNHWLRTTQPPRFGHGWLLLLVGMYVRTSYRRVKLQR